ncbi:MAG: hypothetical protein J6C64_12955 [Lachnospiraceae bacterium]|nr:hypothetical protein [Lachnospiraceae bacterium]
MSDTSPITKEELIIAITSTLEVVRPEFDDPAYKAVVEFANELQNQLEKL